MPRPWASLGFDEAEQDRLLKATYWQDKITKAKWPVVLGLEGTTS